MNLALLLASIFLISISSPLAVAAAAAAAAQPDSVIDGDRLLEWQTLTKQNFSSQIQIHPSILLIVTVPWCGESLSLMRDLSHVITQTPSGLEGLKLMRLYRNKEKMLADSLGAGEEITIIQYHNFVPYKYRGRLRAVNILKSIASMVSLKPAELPLKSLDTHEELLDFIESTDKAVILFESCGWTTRLLNKDALINTPVGAKTSYSPILGSGWAQKVAGHKDAPMCDIRHGFYGFPSFEEFSFSSLNDRISSSNRDDSIIASGSPCNSKEFELFDSFLTKFINSAREMFLPLEKQRYGFVSERSLITSGTNESRPWSVMLHFPGCRDCTKTFKEGDDLDNFLQMDVPPVTELEDDGHHADVLLGNNPSLILFVDRSSNLSTVREASKSALKAFREVALSYHVPYRAVYNSNALSVVESSAVEASKKTFEHPKLELSPISQRIKATQKMSIVIMDGEKRISIDKIASDFQGSSLQKIVDQITRPAKGSKLSLVAREAGFQLLSDDLDIHVDESLQTDKEISYDQPLPELALGSSAADSKKDEVQPFLDAAAPIIQEEASEPVTAQPISREYEKIVDPSVEPCPLSENCHSATVTDIVDRTENSSPTTTIDETSPRFKNFEGNFYFSDGGYRLLRSLTGSSKMPSLVIIDPTVPTHYVLRDDASFGFSHLIGFVDRFTNKSLSPYHLSEYSATKPRETTLPSHVKLGFHDLESIPKVSARELSNILKNIREPHTSGSGGGGGGGKGDVLVLFGNSWCAFCQKMELVVREVYHALRGYEKMLQEEPKTAESASNVDLHDLSLNIPHVYTIDCTMNDCSAILESTGQIEAYPSLLLFPGDKKDIMTYDGNMEVSGIIRFLADRGSYSTHLVGEKGILWTKGDSKENDLEVFDGSTSLYPQLEIFNKPNEPFEVRLLSSSSKHTVKWDWIQPEISEVTLQPSHKVTVGSVLVATAKLLEAYPFDQSKILIVKADENAGYQGLILNKHINWNSFQELTEGSEMLTLAPLSLGGPVIAHENPLVALARKHIKNDYPEVVPGVYFLDQSATALEIGEIKSGNKLNVSDYWFFLGYSSWGWEQLHNEIAEKAWKVTDDISTQFQWP
ncbi:hypothetical protein QQ045_016972 [Rhodiola kirilowii]